ncbi:MAG: D-alanyl-D-alanine carboxypeptidase [Clostridium sp.]|nr:D-alanyl-D-alanine carboxypeptidase [Clostridium sp.]
MKKKLFLLLTVLLTFSLCSNVYADENTNNLNLTSDSAVSIDAKTGEIICEKNIDKRVYPASTTKLLTALILADSNKNKDIFTYTNSAKLQPSSSINDDKLSINVGDKIKADAVLKSMLIFSANDMAYVIADNLIGNTNASIADTQNNFSKIMNKYVAKFGLKNTHFVTPNGLHDPNHYTTAYDISIIGKNAFENKEILDAVKTKNYDLKLENGKSVQIENRNKLILPNSGLYDSTCIGGKTGFTSEAGECLVSIFNRNGREIIGAVMHSKVTPDGTEAFKDMETLINYSYSVKNTTLYKKNSLYKTEKLSYKSFGFFGPTKTIKVPLLLRDDVNYYKNSTNDNEKAFSVNLNTDNPWSIASKPYSVGKLKLTERGVTKEYDLYTTLSKKQLLESNAPLYGVTLTILIIIAAGGVYTFSVRKKR